MNSHLTEQALERNQWQ